MKSTFDKFILMTIATSTTFIASIIGMTLSLEQGKYYDKVVTQPIEATQAFFSAPNHIKNKYKAFLEEDRKTLRQLNLPQQIVEIDVLLKQHQPIDKLFYPFMKMGYKFADFSEDMIINSRYKYEGNMSAYSRIIGNSERKIIYLGINALETKDEGIYAGFYRAFNEDQRMLTSFIFYHEIAHAVSHQIFLLKDELEQIYQTFEKQNKILTPEDKKIIATQYEETFCDVFALHLMKKRYPSLDMKDTQEMLAGQRYLDEEFSHLTAPGLLSLPHIADTDLFTILKNSQKAAFRNTQFYSQALPFSSHRKFVHLAPTNEKEIVQKMHQSRAKVLVKRFKQSGY